jgi:hypothetical protein
MVASGNMDEATKHLLQKHLPFVVKKMLGVLFIYFITIVSGKLCLTPHQFFLSFF